MNLKQHTIKEAVSVEGVGLHTGAIVKMTFKPAAPDHGIKFQRIDLEGQPIVEADADNVVDVSRGTTLEQNGARVYTTEHVLAALVGLQIDNVLIELDGVETPIMDGSSVEFIKALDSVGTKEQNAFREYFEITEGINYKDPEREVEIQALPSEEYRVTVMVDYNSKVLGSQYTAMHNINEFKDEFSMCRTFCFFHELQQLKAAGLIKGGDLNNAIVIVDKEVPDDELQEMASLFNKERIEVQKEGILNNLELRYKNEPARHKLLDVLGDLALIGKPIKGQILAARPGHAANVEFAKKVKAAIKAKGKKTAPKYDPNAKPLYDSTEIYKALPHEAPFKMVDKIISLDHKAVVGVKNVSVADPVFQGHFPGNPVYPGVLLVETIAQVGGIFVLNTVDDPENYWTYFMGVDGCKFRHPVKPGDTVVMKCVLKSPIRRGIAQMHGEAYVGDKLVCETDIMASIVKK